MPGVKRPLDHSRSGSEFVPTSIFVHAGAPLVWFRHMAPSFSHHRRVSADQAASRRHTGRRLEPMAFVVAFAGCSLAWAGLASLGDGLALEGLLTWVGLILLAFGPFMAWAAALHWSTGWEAATPEAIGHVKNRLNEERKVVLDGWLHDGCPVLWRDLRMLERCQRRVTTMKETGRP